MPTALLPNGQTTYVQNSLEVSVSFADTKAAAQVDRALREALADDRRQLFVRVQGGGGYGPWCFWIQWGRGANCCGTPPVILAENERTPEAIVARVKQQLATLESSDQNPSVSG